MIRRALSGPDAALVRREVGPVAWCALEVLTERSVDGCTSVASVRAVAAELGIAKNTAHRALTLLARDGLVAPVQARDTDGRFQPGRYQLHIAHLLTPDRTRRRTPPTAQQLTLLA